MPVIQPHEIVPDGDGGCSACPLPASNKVHVDAPPRPAEDLPALPILPPPVGLDAPVTSHEAAARSTPRQGTKQARLLDLIAARPLGATSDELEALTGWVHQSVSAALNALENAGWLVILHGPDGRPVRRLTRTDNPANAYTLSPAAWRHRENMAQHA